MPNLKLYLTLSFNFFFTILFLSAQNTYVVTANYDDPSTPHTIYDCAPGNTNCPLRAAIQKANIDGKTSTIIFNLSPPSVIGLKEELPALIEAQTLIDGLDDTYQNYVPGQLIIDGGALNQGHGITIDAADCAIYGLYIRNFIATNNDFGIYATKSGENAKIINNVVNNNGGGIHIAANEVIIESNHIGLLFGNEIAEGNRTYGIEVNGTDMPITCRIGLDGTNYIGDNGGSGIYAHGDVIISIQNNIIGSTEKKALDFGNGKTYGVGGGIRLDVSPDSYGEIINNHIVFNDTNGIRFGTNTSNFQVEDNDIFNHSGYGIMMKDEEIGNINNKNKKVTFNRFRCNCAGGIALQNEANSNKETPIIQYIDQGFIRGKATPDDLVELYYVYRDCEFNEITCNDPCQGDEYITTVTADATTGIWELNWNFDLEKKVTVLATDIDENTSEFSDCRFPQIVNDDVCNPIPLPLNPDDCTGEAVTASNFNATAINTPDDAACEDRFDFRDIWFKVDTDGDFFGNMLIKQRPGTTLDISVEVNQGFCNNYYPIDCANFADGQKYLILEGLQLFNGEEIYIRAWANENGFAPIGDIALSAHVMSENLDTPSLCDHNDTPFEPTQFIAVLEPELTENEIQEEIAFLKQTGQVKRCECSPQEMLLWTSDANSLVDMEARRKGANSRTKIDTTTYNNRVDIKILNPFGSPETIDDEYAPTTNEPAIKVAIIDTGVEETNGLISPAIWQNTAPIVTCVNNDVIGYDFFAEDADPNDRDSHGTAVNGIVTQEFPNDIKLDLINAKFHQQGNGTLFDGVCGIHYAIELGVPVANLSWGLRSKNIPKILEDALLRAQTEDMLLLTSAGNLGQNNDQIEKFPANLKLDNMITVAAFAVTADTIFAPYSNFGFHSVDIAAQGTSFSSTLGNGMDVFSGTSIATPFVTQTAAIMRVEHPELTAPQIKTCILNTVDFQRNMRGKVNTEGVLDQVAALACAASTTPPLSIINVPLKGEWKEAKAIELQWSISLPLESVTFEILHRTANSSWKKIHQFSSIQPDQLQTYLFKDIQAQQHYFKIKVNTESGAIYHSDVLFLEKPNPEQILTIYPNPISKNELIINLQETNNPLNIKIFTAMGQLVFQNKVINQQAFGIPSLEAGIYFLQIESGKDSWQRKIIVQH